MWLLGEAIERRRDGREGDEGIGGKEGEEGKREHFTFYQPIMCCRCFGLLVSPGKDVKVTHMDLLDNMVSDCKQWPLYMYTNPAILGVC